MFSLTHPRNALSRFEPTLERYVIMQWPLISASFYCSVAHSKPVVRNRTIIHVMDWVLVNRSEDDELPSDLLLIIKVEFLSSESADIVSK